MITGIYQSASGMDSLIRMQEIIANNLANISTHGFKQEVLAIEQRDPFRLIASSQLDLKPGAIQMTDVPVHLAVTGEGFFTVATPEGIAYTRNGNFCLDNQGRLVTIEGYPVQGQNGEIVIDDPGFSVSESGEIIVKGEVIDQLQIVNGSGPMKRLGNSLMTWETEDAVFPLEANQIQVMQGALEGSNVNVVESMVDMMMVMRMYEANKKALESQDLTLQQVISEVGKVR